MGKAVEETARNFGDDIVLIIDSEDDWKSNGPNLLQADVAIEFTLPHAAPENIRRCFMAGIPVVSGTTGWNNQMETIRNECIEGGNTLLVSPNFSIGVNIFFRLNRYLARLMNKASQYNVSIEETHHIHKLDAPSGTAIRLANDLISLLERKNGWVPGTKAESDQICVISHRIGEVAGTHTVKYESDEDELIIQHAARGRMGFARGALLASHWIIGKKGFYTMDDFMDDFLGISQ